MSGHGLHGVKGALAGGTTAVLAPVLAPALAPVLAPALAPVLAPVLALGLALGLVLGHGSVARAQTRMFNVALSDRVDPVRPAEEIVYSIEIENSFLTPAPDTVLTAFLPPGTTYVAAYRKPDWAELVAEPSPGAVSFELGSLSPCGHVELAPCRDVSLVLRVAPDVTPGTVLETRVELRASDPATFRTDAARVYTSIGSAAIRNARVALPDLPGRDRIAVEADLARSGIATPLHGATPTIDPTRGVRVILREPGGLVALDVSVGADDVSCSGVSDIQCTLRDPDAYTALGLRRLTIRLPALSRRRANAFVVVRTTRLSLPDDFGPTLELVVESGGVIYQDSAELKPGRRQLTYSHSERKP